jgi:hypothetical protein
MLKRRHAHVPFPNEVSAVAGTPEQTREARHGARNPGEAGVVVDPIARARIAVQYGHVERVPARQQGCTGGCAEPVVGSPVVGQYFETSSGGVVRVLKPACPCLKV